MTTTPPTPPPVGLAPEMSSGVRKTREYVCRYYHDGAWWGLNIHAYDMADAEARVAKLGNLQLNGELLMTIHAVPGGNWIPRLICWVRNLFS
jgi:hypothetical protein